MFRFDKLFYAVPLLRLWKIEHGIAGFRLPRLPSPVAETLVCDRQLIPLLRLKIDIGLARAAQYKVFVESEAGQVALPADETCGIVPANKGTFLPVSEQPKISSYGVFNYQTKEYNVLDLDKLAFEMAQERNA